MAELDEASKSLGTGVGNDQLSAVRLLSQRNFDAIQYSTEANNLTLDVRYPDCVDQFELIHAYVAKSRKEIFWTNKSILCYYVINILLLTEYSTKKNDFEPFSLICGCTRVFSYEFLLYDRVCIVHQNDLRLQTSMAIWPITTISSSYQLLMRQGEAQKMTSEKSLEGSIHFFFFFHLVTSSVCCL